MNALTMILIVKVEHIPPRGISCSFLRVNKKYRHGYRNM